MGPVTGAGLLAMALPLAAQAASPVRSCDELAKLALPSATVTAAEPVAAGQYQMPDGPLSHIMSQPGMNVAGHVREASNPAFCRVAVTLTPSSDSDIKVEVWLPLGGWNGKFLGVGNFGWAGSLMASGMLSGLAEGYVTASTDTGHDSTTREGQGGRFALGHLEKLIDYAYRADHLMTLQAKAIIEFFYGVSPARSYWIGCSLGGLEGLIEAKRYPDDYDGIVVGAPPNPIVNFNAQQLWAGWLSNRNPDMQIPKPKFAMVNDAVMKACALPTGLKQGFVDEPDTCAFQPKQLLCKGADAPDCLTAPQVRMLEQIYTGPVNPRTGELIFPGPARGSEAGFAADGEPFPVALDLFTYAAFENPDWDWKTLDWDKDIAAATAKVGPLLHVDADLTPFFARGGKLLMYIGWNDGHNPAELIDYYKSVIRTAGDRNRASARLFTIPGMAHCYGGAGCDTFNKLRLLCAYPEVARYKGAGDVGDATNFACSSQ